MSFFKILFNTIFVAALVSGCQSRNSPEVDQESLNLAKQSDLQINEKNFDSAFILVSMALAIDSNNYIAYNNRAYLEIQQNKPSQEVIDDYKKAIAIAPEYATATFSLANYYFQTKDYQNTITWANKYLSFQLSQKLDPALIESIYFRLAKSEENLLLFDQAIIDYKKAIEINPANVHSHLGLGECYYYGSNNIAVAMAEFTKALDIDSTYAAAYIQREKCDRNIKPPLLKQAESDSMNADRYETNSGNKNDTISIALERARRSLDPKIAKADAFYKSIIALYAPAKEAEQKLIDNMTVDLNKINNKSTAKIDIKYLRELVNDALIANTDLLRKLNEIREIDSAVGLKRKLDIYENSFKKLLVHDMPKFIDILEYANNYRAIAAVDAIKPTMLLIRQQGIEFKNAEEELFNKYSLH
jgi:tetratricopeptide (TPR) repeat protein